MTRTKTYEIKSKRNRKKKVIENCALICVHVESCGGDGRINSELIINIYI